ncbi:F-box protein SKIP23-like [Trifolium pratense]|uniref:F-box protein SKIP23-like n=1 Tax=Trifolium pratense TaxID=57577 RepID=UPI001E6973D9|nr:F-box protein SKIP23-like [Trifolium pratense]
MWVEGGDGDVLILCILKPILKLNNSELYLLRFRSVCSSWRRASVQNCHHNHVPSKLPQFLHSDKINFLRSWSKQNIFLIKPPETLTSTHHRPWLIRIGPDVSGKPQMWHPFDLFLLCPFHQPIIDFNQIPVIHLGHQFYIHDHYHKVVAATCEVGQPLVVLTYDMDNILNIFRCEDNSWTTIPTVPPMLYGGDICIFKGRTCVADKNGRTLMIGENFSVLLLANPVSGGDVKFLVESECDLLLVDGHEVYTSVADKDVKFDVYRLDEKEKKWVKLTTLGDRVLFVQQEGSFSASASDLHVAKGNCIIFCMNYISQSLKNIQSEMRIFHLDQGQVSCLSDYPEYIKLFWPPPKWILELHNSGIYNVVTTPTYQFNDDDDDDDDDD